MKVSTLMDPIIWKKKTNTRISSNQTYSTYIHKDGAISLFQSTTQSFTVTETQVRITITDGIQTVDPECPDIKATSNSVSTLRFLRC